LSNRSATDGVGRTGFVGVSAASITTLPASAGVAGRQLTAVSVVFTQQPNRVRCAVLSATKVGVQAPVPSEIALDLVHTLDRRLVVDPQVTIVVGMKNPFVDRAFGHRDFDRKLADREKWAVIVRGERNANGSAGAAHGAGEAWSD
jgi:hypothetical protein